MRQPMTEKSRSIFVSAACCAAVSLALALPAGAETSAEEAKASQAKQTASASAPALRLPIYKPPRVGKPARTVGGGSRGPGDGIPELYVLVPNHVGQTASEQPALFWFIDELPAEPMRVDFTLLDEDGIDPIVQVTLPAITRAGIHRIDLAQYGVKLQPGVEYEWSVSLVPDEKARAKDIVASGFIDRVEKPSGIDSELAESDHKASAVYVFASRGLWYDALTAIDEQIEKQPGDAELSQIRAALLRQVGLETVAERSL